MSHHAVFISFDNPECGQFAQMISDALLRSGPSPPTVRLIPVHDGESHRDLIAKSMQEFSSLSARDVFVVAAMKDNNTEEYRRVRELCLSFGTASLSRYILTCVKAFTEPSLLAQNVYKSIRQKFA